MKIIERVEAHYNVQAVEFGTVYTWRPESVLIECECGASVVLTASETTCEECGVDHTELIREDLTERRLDGDEEVRPWRYLEKSNAQISLPY